VDKVPVVLYLHTGTYGRLYGGVILDVEEILVEEQILAKTVSGKLIGNLIVNSYEMHACATYTTIYIIL